MAGRRVIRIELEDKDIFADYHPAKALEGLRAGLGMVESMDVDAFVREIKEQRSIAT